MSETKITFWNKSSISLKYSKRSNVYHLSVTHGPSGNNCHIQISDGETRQLLELISDQIQQHDESHPTIYINSGTCGAPKHSTVTHSELCDLAGLPDNSSVRYGRHMTRAVTLLPDESVEVVSGMIFTVLPPVLPNNQVRTDPSSMTPDELRAILARLNWTQAHLANQLGVAEGTVSGWMHAQPTCKGPAAALIRLLSKNDPCPSPSE